MDKSRIGETNINNEGLKMKIIAYRKYKDIDIEFEDGYIAKNRTYGEFNKRTIKDLYYPSIFEFSYIGEGKYNPSIDDKLTIQYKYWNSMLYRCYYEKFQIERLTYKNCTVCIEWHNFQNFAQWFDENYYLIDNEKTSLDKDIIFKNNKIYSPETCIFVPQNINILFTKSNKTRGIYPIGVCYNKISNKFQSNLRINNKKIYLCCYSTPEEAFEIYKTEKEKYIKEVADEHKDKIPKKLYDALYKYEVEIDD